MTDRIRQVSVSASAVLAVVGALLGSGALGGPGVPAASGGAFASDATPIAPGGPAFSIWSVIYLGLIAYTVWQWLPRQTTAARHRQTGYPIALSMILNAGWLLAVRASVLWLTLVVIVALLAVLVVVFTRLLRTQRSSVIDAVVTDGTIGLYLGWVVVATTANAAAVLAATGWGETVSAPDAWAVGVLAVAGVVGVALAVWSRGRLALGAALCWGLTWVGVARLTGDLVSGPAAVAAISSAAAVLVATAVARFMAGNRPERALQREA